jgi:phosphate transport system substrate-binding protein
LPAQTGSVRSFKQALVAPALLLLASCGGSAVPPTASQPASAGVSKAGLNAQLLGAGSTFDFPLFSKVFDAYGKQTGVQVNYQSVGSGAGIEQLIKKTVDFGATDAPLTAEQENSAGRDVLHIPVTMGAVALGYNLPGVKGLKLDADTLAGLYLGQIKKWNDPKIAALNPDAKLPPTDVAVAYRSDGSGTSFIFTSYLSSISPDWKSKVGSGTSVKWPAGIGGKGSEGVSGQVASTPGAIGYFELAYALQNNISTIQLKNQAGSFVEPSVNGATEAAAGAANNMPADLKAVFVNAPGPASYPIAGFSWIVVYKNQPDAAKGKALVDLLTYMVTKGQQFAEPLYYAPLPATVETKSADAIKTISLGGQPA